MLAQLRGASRGFVNGAGYLILFGNADSNGAWARVFAAAPFDVRRGRLRLGEREWRGNELGAVFVHPSSLHDRNEVGALAGAFADTGIAGTRSGYLLAPFASGIGYPDYAVWGPAIWTQGDGGVLAAGWFDATWALDERSCIDRAMPCFAHGRPDRRSLQRAE